MSVHVTSTSCAADGYMWTCQCGERGNGYATDGGAAAGGWLHRVLQRFVSRPTVQPKRPDPESWGSE